MIEYRFVLNYSKWNFFCELWFNDKETKQQQILNFAEPFVMRIAHMIFPFLNCLQQVYGLWLDNSNSLDIKFLFIYDTG